MVINHSNIDMSASSKARVDIKTKREELSTNILTGEKRYTSNTFSAVYEELKTEDNYNNYNNHALIKNRSNEPEYAISDRERSVNELLMQLRAYLISMRERLNRILGRGVFGTDTLSLAAGTGGVSVWRVNRCETYEYHESSSMSFSTVGKVLTADGRQLDFDMQIDMSHEYSMEYSSSMSEVKTILTDPLVISLDSNPVSVSDMKWQFDIDGDGEKDSVSLLSKGTGFLCFDKNEDGIINDGLEMFGARTGNGFAELMEFDEDKNGWIDEKDSIYEKLSVWTKDDSGQDKLIGLKAANVGAIYLGNVKTAFDMKSVEDNSENAKLRRSGMYLTEDGQARTIAQLDMVKSLIK